MATLHITPKFWDFIEANVPNYHQREDVLRQSELQLFIDGHESSVQGITQQEAVLLRDRILFRLYHEAIDNFTDNLPVSICEESDLRDYAEIIADIAYQAGERGFRPSNNSRETINTIIGWAGEFSHMHKDTDWREKEYLDEMYNFTDEKLASASTIENGKCESYVLVEFPDDPSYFEENDIGYPSFESEDNGARYVPETEYIRHFKKDPPSNAYFKPLQWPESQSYLFPDESNESVDALCEPVDDEKGRADFGEQAMWVPLCILSKNHQDNE